MKGKDYAPKKWLAVLCLYSYCSRCFYSWDSVPSANLVDCTPHLFPAISVPLGAGGET